LIVANIEAFSETALIGLVQAYRQSRGITAPVSTPAPAPAHVPTPRAPPPHVVPPATSSRISTPEVPAPVSVAPVVKDEPVDPLQMDIDEDELEYEPDRLNEEVWTVCHAPTIR
jgi:symplekin